jgi:hypothetical protein
MGPKGIKQCSNGLSIYDRLRQYPDLVPSMLTEMVSFGTQNTCEPFILMILEDFRNLETILNPLHMHIGFALAKHSSNLGHFAVLPMCFEFLSKAQVKYWHDYVADPDAVPMYQVDKSSSLYY